MPRSDRASRRSSRRRTGRGQSAHSCICPIPGGGRLCCYMPEAAEAAGAAFWPGALNAGAAAAGPGAGIPRSVTRVLRRWPSGCPIMPWRGASARRGAASGGALGQIPSGRLSPTTAAHVLGGLDGRIAAVTGRRALRVGGRVDDRRVRPGPGAAAARGTAAGGAGGLSGWDPREVMPGRRPVAPGQLVSHYAPRGALRMEATVGGRVRPRGIRRGCGREPVGGGRSRGGGGGAVPGLHRLDAAGVERIAVAPIPETGLGLAINDRLRRAAGAKGLAPAARVSGSRRPGLVAAKKIDGALGAEHRHPDAGPSSATPPVPSMSKSSAVARRRSPSRRITGSLTRWRDRPPRSPPPPRRLSGAGQGDLEPEALCGRGSRGRSGAPHRPLRRSTVGPRGGDDLRRAAALGGQLRDEWAADGNADVGADAEISTSPRDHRVAASLGRRELEAESRRARCSRWSACRWRG